jgi:polyvinyl alcohol dehydrogenase (cytochrome)
MKLVFSAISLSLVLSLLAATPQAQTPAPSSAGVGTCPSNPAMSDPAAGLHWNGWGPSVTNTRFQAADQARLSAADVPKLKLKWAFAFPNANRSRSQATVAGGRLFVANETGAVYALDPKTGCTYWTFQAQSDVRTAISIGPRTGAAGYAVYFADGKANAYALDAAAGRQLWVRKIEDHQLARITGAPTLYNGRLYVPATGVGEENGAARPEYECCTFRGSLSALDAATGNVAWKAYTIPDEPKPRGKSNAGAPLWGPAGGGIWSAPTVDVKRGAIYVSTGNGYSDPPQPTTDAVIALDLQTGKVKWVSQVLPNDVWGLGCGPNKNPSCPENVGPDFDFSAAPVLATLTGGRDLIVIPQKSGVGYALDPDKNGARVWEYRFGRGSGIGGVWGTAVDSEQAYFAVADQRTPAPGGLHAVRLSDGQRAWFTPPSKPLCGSGNGCSAAQSAAVTAIPGVVFSGSADGGLRAYSTKDGSIIWEYDTNRTFDAVNGVKANGGSIDLAGPIVVGGMVYATSGNGGIVGRPGNVLLAFGVD